MTVTPAHAALVRATNFLVDRLAQLEERIVGGDETGWPSYYEAVKALSAVAPAMAPGAGGRLLTTRALAATMNVSTKTVLRKRARGELQAVRLGQRGRGALRWRAETGRSA